jgi:hypothetical protein
VAATQGRAWTRITSLAALRAVGREFSNCLARTQLTSTYGGHLQEGRAQFWVLRDARGVGLMVAMASTASPTEFREVKGPRNTPVSRANIDLQCLADAILSAPMPPPDPTPVSGALRRPEPPPRRAAAPTFPMTVFAALGGEEPVVRLEAAPLEALYASRRRKAS